MAATTVVVVGTGGFGRYHIRAMLGQRRTTRIVALVEPSPASQEATRQLFAELGCRCPPNFATLADFLKQHDPAETALICTPHNCHFDNLRECLQAGMDVFVEKPMVMNAEEARQVIRLRDKLGRLVVVGFPGSLSPAIRKAKQLLAAGAIGKVSAISAFAHQQWKTGTTGKWRQQPETSGGGFLFDTGSHMVNTVVDLLGEDVVEVAAMLDNRGTPVEIASSVTARTTSGVLVSLTGAGDSIQCRSQVTVFGEAGILQTGIWGECLRLRGPKDAEFKDVKLPRSKGAWQQFLLVRAGKIANPCPPEVGLRFALLMDRVRASAKAQ